MAKKQMNYSLGADVRTEHTQYHIPTGCKPRVKPYTTKDNPGKINHVERLTHRKLPYRCYDCGASIEEFLMSLPESQRIKENNRICSECKEKHIRNSTCKTCGEKLEDDPRYTIKICKFLFCPTVIRRKRK